MRYMLIGLGNPGQQYEQTRHNAGFWLADSFAELNQCDLLNKPKLYAHLGKVEVNGDDWIILKPTTYMNRSGIAVRQASGYYNIPVENILVAHDELDFAPGVIRFKRGGGHGGHNGLRDIFAQLGNNCFARLRIGIGRADEMANYVLKPPGVEQRIEIDNAIQRAVILLPKLMGDQSQQAVQNLHMS